jgi:subtilase family serine protease
VLEGEKAILRDQVAGLEGDKLILEGEKVTLKDQVSSLEGEKAALGDQVSSLESSSDTWRTISIVAIVIGIVIGAAIVNMRRRQ